MSWSGSLTRLSPAPDGTHRALITISHLKTPATHHASAVVAVQRQTARVQHWTASCADAADAIKTYLRRAAPGWRGVRRVQVPSNLTGGVKNKGGENNNGGDKGMTMDEIVAAAEAEEDAEEVKLEMSANPKEAFAATISAADELDAKEAAEADAIAAAAMEDMGVTGDIDSEGDMASAEDEDGENLEDDEEDEDGENLEDDEDDEVALQEMLALWQAIFPWSIQGEAYTTEVEAGSGVHATQLASHELRAIETEADQRAVRAALKKLELMNEIDVVDPMTQEATFAFDAFPVTSWIVYGFKVVLPRVRNLLAAGKAKSGVVHMAHVRVPVTVMTEAETSKATALVAACRKYLKKKLAREFGSEEQFASKKKILPPRMWTHLTAALLGLPNKTEHAWSLASLQAWRNQVVPLFVTAVKLNFTMAALGRGASGKWNETAKAVLEKRLADPRQATAAQKIIHDAKAEVKRKLEQHDERANRELQRAANSASHTLADQTLVLDQYVRGVTGEDAGDVFERAADRKQRLAEEAELVDAVLQEEDDVEFSVPGVDELMDARKEVQSLSEEAHAWITRDRARERKLAKAQRVRRRVAFRAAALFAELERKGRAPSHALRNAIQSGDLVTNPRQFSNGKAPHFTSKLYFSRVEAESSADDWDGLIAWRDSLSEEERHAARANPDDRRDLEDAERASEIRALLEEADVSEVQDDEENKFAAVLRADGKLMAWARAAVGVALSWSS